MNLSQLFKAAHAITKTIVAVGDSYSVTFGSTIKMLSAAKRGDNDALYGVQNIAQTMRKAADTAIDSAFEALDAARDEAARRWAANARSVMERMRSLASAARAAITGLVADYRTTRSAETRVSYIEGITADIVDGIEEMSAEGI